MAPAVATGWVPHWGASSRASSRAFHGGAGTAAACDGLTRVLSSSSATENAIGPATARASRRDASGATEAIGTVSADSAGAAAAAASAAGDAGAAAAAVGTGGLCAELGAELGAEMGAEMGAENGVAIS